MCAVQSQCYYQSCQCLLAMLGLVLQEGRRFVGRDVVQQPLFPSISREQWSNKETLISLLGCVVEHLRGPSKFRLTKLHPNKPVWWPADLPFTRIDKRSHMAHFPAGSFWLLLFYSLLLHETKCASHQLPYQVDIARICIYNVMRS